MARLNITTRVVFGPGNRRVSVPREGYRHVGMHEGRLFIDVLVTPAPFRDLVLLAESIVLQSSRPGETSRPGDTRCEDILTVMIGGGTVKIPGTFHALAQTTPTSFS